MLGQVPPGPPTVTLVGAMCLAVYIASDQPLPLVHWSPTDPGFYVRPVDEMDNGVGEIFSVPFVYYAGSHEGCGDGFEFGREPAQSVEDQDRERKGRASVERLASYLRDASQLGQVHVYARWADDPVPPNGQPAALRLGEMTGRKFWFEDNRLHVVQAD